MTGHKHSLIAKLFPPVGFLLAGVIVLLPLVCLGYLALQAKQLEFAPLIRAFLASLPLLLIVGIICAIIGVVSAWIVAVYEFPLRRFFIIGLVLPLALPTYLAAYIAVEMTDYFGPLQQGLRWLIGAKSRKDYYFPEMRSFGGAAFVLSLVLYPYIYAACYLMFSRQRASIVQAAQILGASDVKLFFSIGLPLAKPAFFAGLAFVLFEALNDIGATEYLGVHGVSVSIRDLWLNQNSLGQAAQLSLLSLSFVIVLLIIAQKNHVKNHFNMGRSRALQARSVSKRAQYCMILFCALPVFLGFIFPFGFVLFEALHLLLKQGVSVETLHLLGRSLFIAFIGSVLILTIGSFLALSARFSKGFWLTRLIRITNICYAMPGTILALALLPVFVFLQSFSGWAILAGILPLLAVYFFRFSGIGIAHMSMSLSRLSPNIDHAARILGATNLQIMQQIHLNQLFASMAPAFALVFMDILKELPATLLLRPLNSETLATSLYAQASRGAYEEGAVEALLLLLGGILPALLMLKRQKRRSHSSP